MLQIFTNGLLRRKHEYMLAIETEHQKQDGETHRMTHVLHNETNALQCLPKEMDFIVEDLLKQLRQQGLKPVEVHCVDLGPMGTVMNRMNKALP